MMQPQLRWDPGPKFCFGRARVVGFRARLPSLGIALLVAAGLHSGCGGGAGTRDIEETVSTPDEPISPPEEVDSPPEEVVSLPETIISLPETIISLPETIISSPDKETQDCITTAEHGCVMPGVFKTLVDPVAEEYRAFDPIHQPVGAERDPGGPKLRAPRPCSG